MKLLIKYLIVAELFISEGAALAHSNHLFDRFFWISVMPGILAGFFFFTFFELKK